MGLAEFEIVFLGEALTYPKGFGQSGRDWALGPGHEKRPKVPRVSPMKIDMMLHFYGVVGPYVPENARTSSAYTQFVKELLHDGLIVRPTHRQREEYSGWAYRATEKGEAWVHAICTVPVPVAKTRWIIPS